MKRQQKDHSITIRVPQIFKDQLEEIAAQEYTSISEVCRRALLDWLRGDEEIPASEARRQRGPTLPQ